MGQPCTLQEFNSLDLTYWLKLFVSSRLQMITKRSQTSNRKIQLSIVEFDKKIQKNQNQNEKNNPIKL